MKLIARRVEEKKKKKKEDCERDKSFKSLSESESWGNKKEEKKNAQKVKEREREWNKKVQKEGNVQTKRALKSVKEARSC